MRLAVTAATPTDWSTLMYWIAIVMGTLPRTNLCDRWGVAIGAVARACECRHGRLSHHPNPSDMTASLTKHFWLALALTAMGLVLGSLILTAWLGLHPCHLCIFQRLLFMKIALLGLAAYVLRDAWRRLAGGLVLPLSATGVGVASYQSWLQAQPPGSVSCVGGNPGMIEQLVEWLGQRVPELFLATGFCEEAELSILGLTLANWALLSFAVFFLAGLWALFNEKEPTQ